MVAAKSESKPVTPAPASTKAKIDAGIDSSKPNANQSINKATRHQQKGLKNKIQKSKKPRQITKNTIYFTIFVVAWSILATMVAQYVIALPMAFLLGEKVNQPSWMLLYYVLTYALSLVLVILVPVQVLKLYRQRNPKSANLKNAIKLENELAVTANDMGVQNLPTFVDIGLAPVGYAAYLILATILTSLMSIFTWFDANQAQNVGFGYFITDIDRICAMLAVVFIAPLAEELIMRGWLYGKLRRKWGIIAAMLLTSLAFAVMHGQWNVGVSVFALSIVLCALREITGTIWSGILLHMLSNGIAFYLLYVAV